MALEADGTLSPLLRKPLYEQLAERLREFVAEAGLAAGDRLPAERDLAKQLGVSRSSIRQAMVALEVQGLVDIRHGEGTFLRVAKVEATPLESLLDLRRRLPSILDAREAMEVKLAELAAERRTEADVAAMDAALELMRSEVDHGGLGEDGDRAFHESIVSAARSELIAHMYTMIAEEIAASRRESLSQIERPQASLAQHCKIAEAIRSHDGLAAARAMRDHLRTVRSVRLLSWSPPDE